MPSYAVLTMRAVFTLDSGAPTNVTTLTLTIRSGDKVWNKTLADMTNPSTGVYTYEHQCDEPGLYTWEWYGATADLWRKLKAQRVIE
jgi:hypothetical protein